ncbi:LLM class F420-dependent oxidoreductase [Nocardioides sp. zg-ZUI104]|uniref:LLM class F420-dependent oxidoreductase n=1 Tax=Nocardioides faecalis TaxID=2803858 RepID=UPI001BCDE0DE|nr:LLM class F420-dependent oxidoreductase [Nocardioides faecalis]MBS4754553.1 LLM class F420-dependent oxidoreductase [Nocardioides faecalis]
MDIGLVYIVDGRPGRGLEFAQSCAVEAEKLGYQSIWAPDHVAFFDEYSSRYPHSDTGKFKFLPNQGHIDDLQVLLAAAMVTSTIRLGTSVEVVAMRNPLTRAREIATLDQFSGGRFQYGVGVGWKAEEFSAAGVPFERRGVRADHHIEAMRALWTQERASYHSEFVNFDDVIMFPKPAQTPHPPILVGGVSRVALRRAARLGDGWYGWKLTHDELAECVSILDEELEKVGRSREGFRVLLGAPHREGLVDDLDRYAELGVDEFMFGYSLSREHHAEQLAQHAQDLGSWLGK